MDEQLHANVMVTPIMQTLLDFCISRSSMTTAEFWKAVLAKKLHIQVQVHYSQGITYTIPGRMGANQLHSSVSFIQLSWVIQKCGCC